MLSRVPLPVPAASARRHFVTLANGRRVTLGAYVAAWRTVRSADPAARYHGAPNSWFGEPEPAETILRQFRAGMHDRINRHLPGFGRGRKWSDQWFFDALRAARDVNTPRLIVRWIPAEFRSRLAHRLTVE